MCIRDRSSLLLRFTDNIFNEAYFSTIGVDFKIKSIKSDGKAIKLQLWDTAGQERFKNITTTYYKGSHGAFIVFDLTDYNSFANAEMWLREIRANTDRDVEVILIGNKNDLAEKRVIDADVARGWAEARGLKYFESSAKTGENVEAMFNELSMLMKENCKSETNVPYGNRGTTILTTPIYSPKKKPEEEKKSNCC
eukprot:TRINITY_DN2626_c0_g1_i3.p1 TRINITY_DN2626_c0_g1~~TRINITY_DN2626_c0_g1_i3.p1  ORF type:complete len:215 (+),score=56.00 TRINITY_DN2626_c0_g1_i3:61-645(+)